MASSIVERGVTVVADTAQMIVVHLSRITGVLAKAVTRAGDEVTEMALDCRDVAKDGLRPRPSSLDLPPGTADVDLRDRGGSPRRL